MSPTLKAALWMIGTITSFTSMAVAGRAIGDAHDTFEIMFFRSLFGVLIVCSALTFTKRWHEIKTDKLGLHVARNVFHFTGQNLWFFALAFIPLAQVFALEFTTPIWAMIFAPLIVGERLTVFRAIAAVMGFIGILLVTRPGTLEMNPGVYAGAASAVFFALSILMTKRLTRTQSIGCILFWLTTTQAVMGLATAGYDGQITLPTLHTLPFLLLIGFAGLCAHFCLTVALSIAPASVVTPIDFARLPVIAVIGALFYAEPLDAFVMAGAVLIFSGNYLNIWRETRNG
ncbi:MAG: DMT family transporter [Rhodobacteraceae bacterium]|nr:DMT family transporter [Paracoccaceae bacterium]